MEQKKNEMEVLLEKSKATDLGVLLSSKEKAKRLMMDDPSSTNLSAYRQASQMLEAVMEEQKNLKDYTEVLKYAKEENRKLGRTKFYEDLNNAKFKKQADGSFKLRDIDKYFKTLPLLSATDKQIGSAEKRHREKEEAEIRRLKASAAQAEFDLARKQGQFIPKDRLYLELSARAILLSTSIKTAFEVHLMELIESVEGNPKTAKVFQERLENIFDGALNEYSQELAFEIDFDLENENNYEQVNDQE